LVSLPINFVLIQKRCDQKKNLLGIAKERDNETKLG